MLNAQHAKYVAYRLGKARADNDPAVPFTVYDGLRQVCDGGKCKENCKEICSTDIRTERP